MVLHSCRGRSVQFYGYKFGSIAVFHVSVIMHSFQKLVSDLGTFLQLCTNKTAIEFALYGYEHKDLAFLIYLGHLLWSLQSMGRISIYNEERQKACLYGTITSTLT